MPDRSPVVSTVQSAGTDTSKDGVVLLHGIFRTHRSMRRLEKFIARHGYRTLNVGYPSTRQALERLAETIHPAINAFARTVPGKVHFIGYSMGGLVIRAYLHRFRPANLGRVVMLAVPNNGSELADFVRNWRLYKMLYGPAGQQLITTLSEPEQLFGQVSYELGVVAGSLSLDPIVNRIMGGPNDGKVSVESTRLDGMTDHRIVRSGHMLFPTSRAVWRHTLHFLQEGRFA